MIGKDRFRGMACALLLALTPSVVGAQETEQEPAPPNVLLIVIDDLNDWIGPLGGHPDAKTPFLDELARRGTTFTNAHTSTPICNPSRAALLTGLRPTSTGLYAMHDSWGAALRGRRLFPAFFQAHDYSTSALGKVNRYGDQSLPVWSRTGWDASINPRPEIDAGAVHQVAGLSWLPLAADGGRTGDELVTEEVEALLAADSEVPFLLACGLVGPHLPWVAPEEYFELHAAAALPAVQAGDLEDVPKAARFLHLSTSPDHAAIVEADAWQDAVQGYLAATSFADALIGRVLAALDAGPHAGNTIVVVTSDHGFHLGEKEHWLKFTLWEESTRVPLIVVAPGVTQPGSRCDRPVELVSLYATLAELCGLEPPQGLDGPSLVPLLRDPRADWSTPAITTYGFGNHAVRTERWRYIRYADGSEELYDHENDPHEWTNLAGDPRFAETRAELAALLPANAAEQVQARRKRRGR